MLAAALLASLSSCAFFDYPSSAPQCEADGDCAARGAAFAGTRCVDSVCQLPVVEGLVDGGLGDASPQADASADPEWSCLGQRSATSLATLPSEIRVIDVETLEPVAGAQLQLCSPTDLSCAHPLFGPVATDASGMALMTLSEPVPGTFIQEKDSAHPTHILPLLFTLTAPVDGTTMSLVMTLLSPPVFQNYATLIGEPIDTSFAQVLFQVANCLGATGGDVSLAIVGAGDPNDAGAAHDGGDGGSVKLDQIVYFQNDQPAPTLTETPEGAADVSGFIGNVPQGTLSFVATANDVHEQVRAASIPIQAGTVVLVGIGP